MPNSIVVLTYKSIDEILLKESSESWKLNPIKASKCKYVICTRNKNDTRKIWHGKEKHREVSLIGKIKSIVKTPFGPGRHRIEFKEYAKVSIPEFWVFNILKRESTIPSNEEIIRHNICNIELQPNIYDV